MRKKIFALFLASFLCAIFMLQSFAVDIAENEDRVVTIDEFFMTDSYVYLEGEHNAEEFLLWFDNETAVLTEKDGGELSGKDAICTGSTLKFLQDGAEKEYTFILLGDMNRDGRVSVYDARIALRIAVKIDTVGDFTDFLTGNIDSDNSISVLDARSILRCAINIETVEEYVNIKIAYSLYLEIYNGEIAAVLYNEYAGSDNVFTVEDFDTELLERVEFFETREDIYSLYLLYLKDSNIDNYDQMMYKFNQLLCVKEIVGRVDLL